jgi:hypothetical protein
MKEHSCALRVIRVAFMVDETNLESVHSSIAIQIENLYVLYMPCETNNAHLIKK